MAVGKKTESNRIWKTSELAHFYCYVYYNRTGILKIQDNSDKEVTKFGNIVNSDIAKFLSNFSYHTIIQFSDMTFINKCHIRKLYYSVL